MKESLETPAAYVAECRNKVVGQVGVGAWASRANRIEPNGA